MDDLISRQAAIDALGERPRVWDAYVHTSEYELGQRNQYDSDRAAIEAVLPADVVEVRHGKWDNDGKCSSCSSYNNIIINNVVYPLKTNYCPHCGAKMEVE